MFEYLDRLISTFFLVIACLLVLMIAAGFGIGYLVFG